MPRLKRDDQVVVIAGKDKGKKGKVLKIFPRSNRAIVEGVNMQERHLRPSRENPQGGKASFEGNIHMSNLMLVDPKTQKKSKVGYVLLNDGSKQRISKISQEVLN